MALFAQTKIDASSVSQAAQGLLAALKGGTGANALGADLFASLLSETSKALPQVKPLAPLPASARQEAPVADQKESNQAEKPEKISQEIAKDSTPRAEKRETVRTDGQKGQEKQSLPSDKEEKAASADVEAPSEDVEAAPLKPEAKELSQTKKGKDETETAEEDGLLALLAALDPFEDSAPAHENIKGPDQMAVEKSETTQNQMTAPKEEATILVQQQMAVAQMKGQADKAKEKGQREAEPQGEVLKKLNTQEAQESLSAKLVPSVDANKEDVQAGAEPEVSDEALEAATFKALMGQASNQNGKPQGATPSALPPREGLAAKFQEASSTQQNVAPAASFAQAISEQTAAQGRATASAQIEALSTAGAKGATQPAGLGEGARSTGPYDFASQLSAARTAKGGSAGLPQAVEQAALQLHKAVKQGQSEMTIHLRPAELGKVEVKLTFLEDNKVRGTVVADKASTLSLLQKDADLLLRSLQEAGLQADPGCLDFSLRGEGNADAFLSDLSGENGRAKKDSSASWAVSEEEASADAEGEVYYITPGGVNLRV